MKYRAVIFDLDGTLLDTLEDLAVSGNNVLAELGFQRHPVDAYKYFVGDGLNVLVERILPDEMRSEEIIRKAVALFKEDYDRRWHNTSDVYAGIEPMLGRLSQLEVELNILSNKPNPFTLKCVEKFLGSYHFTAVFGHRPEVPKKPHPAGALEIIERLRIPKNEILYVGDSAVDMKAAAAAGLDSVGVLWGFRTEAELREAGAKYIIEHPKELVGIVESGSGS